jgi:T-complex protein 1 subunit gamma
MTALRAKHSQDGNFSWGVNGHTGALVDMKELGIWEPLSVKTQTYKTAIETAILLLRIDDIVSGSKKASTLSEKSDSSKGAKQDEDAPQNEQ